MYRKWKGASVLSMAVLIGCLMPMGTMLAAEGNTEDVQKNRTVSVSANTVVSEDEEIPDEPAARVAEVPESIDAPEIDIKWQGKSRTCSLGGKIEYEYVNNLYQSIDCSVSQSGQTVSLSYCLEEVTDTSAEAKGEAQMASLNWASEQSSQVQVHFLHDGNYVLYVKAEGADGQTTYARSGGIVVDTKAPEVTGVEEGTSYPEGTVFHIEDANLESVTINEKPVALSSDGNYQVAANGTSCVIKAKDKAGNSISCSIIVTGRELAEGENVISKTGMYALKTGDAYELAEGRWEIYGDNTVYRGGSTFYVKTAGNYMFVKYQGQR